MPRSWRCIPGRPPALAHLCPVGRPPISQLSDDHVVASISSRLAQDPAFAALMQRACPGLPAASIPLLLEMQDADGPGGRHPAPATGNPVHDLLLAVQHGAAVAVIKIGEVRVPGCFGCQG